jgi:hypothetical protein
MRLWFVAALSIVATLACAGGKDAEDEDSSGGSDTPHDTDTTDDTSTQAADDTGPTSLPDSPFPFTVHVGGAATEDITFDSAECYIPPNNQLQITYKTATLYTWNLRVIVRQTFAGIGTYADNVQVQLYENFSGGRYFAGTGSVDIDGYGTNGLYGTFTTDGMDGDAGTASIAPLPVPIWCDEIVTTSSG